MPAITSRDVGSASLNQELSEDRANNVTQFLQQQGHIPLTNILAPGAMGESRQIGNDLGDYTLYAWAYSRYNANFRTRSMICSSGTSAKVSGNSGAKSSKPSSIRVRFPNGSNRISLITV